jgi:hypothetical protein
MPTLKEGVKHDDGKSRLDLIAGSMLFEMGHVLAKGAKKYDEWNWAKGIKYSRCIGAAQRHLQAFADGEDNDDEWGFSHLAHAACCIMFLMHYQTKRRLYRKFDDRPNFRKLVNSASE